MKYERGFFVEEVHSPALGFWMSSSSQYSDPVENFASTLNFDDGISERFAYVILYP